MTDQMAHAERLDALRLDNVARCFGHLRDAGASTVADLATAVGLSRPAVSKRIPDLIGLGLVREEAPLQKRGQSTGRPATRYAVRDDSGAVVGVDLGRHTNRIVVANLNGAVVDRADFPEDHTLPIARRLERLRAQVAELLGRNAGLGALRAVGAAVPGRPDANGLMTLSMVFPEWNGVNVREALEGVFGVPVALENDLNAAALAENRLGGAPADMVLALVWHQVASGILTDGALQRGRHGAAGDLYRLRSTHRADFRERWPSLPEFRASVAAAEDGDPAELALLEQFAEAAGEQLAHLVVAIDPEALLLFGEAVESDLVCSLVERAATHAVLTPAGTRIERARLGVAAPALGVAMVALEQLSDRIFGEGHAAFRLLDAERAQAETPESGKDTR